MGPEPDETAELGADSGALFGAVEGVLDIEVDDDAVEEDGALLMAGEMPEADVELEIAEDWRAESKRLSA